MFFSTAVQVSPGHFQDTGWQNLNPPFNSVQCTHIHPTKPFISVFVFLFASVMSPTESVYPPLLLLLLFFSFFPSSGIYFPFVACCYSQNAKSEIEDEVTHVICLSFLCLFRCSPFSHGNLNVLDPIWCSVLFSPALYSGTKNISDSRNTSLFQLSNTQASITVFRFCLHDQMYVNVCA